MTMRYHRGNNSTDKTQADASSFVGAKTREFTTLLSSLSLQNVWDIRPLFDVRISLKLSNNQGNNLCKEFGISGTKVGEVLKKQVEWQLQNPELGRDDCKKWIRSHLL